MAHRKLDKLSSRIKLQTHSNGDRDLCHALYVHWL